MESHLAERNASGWAGVETATQHVITTSPVPDLRVHVTYDGTYVNSNTSTVGTETATTEVEAMPIAEAIMFALLMSLCICATIVGNVLVILSVFTYRPLKSVQNFFIVSLAVADLAVAILVMPFNVANFVIGHWVFEGIFCNMWLTFDILTCTASILNLCAIALDRYYAIHDPISYATKRTVKRVLLKIGIVWAASAIISIPPLLGWNSGSNRNLYNAQTKTCQLTSEKSFVIYSASGSFYIPLFIMTFVYANIFLATRRRLRARAKAASAAKMQSMTGKAAAAATSPTAALTQPDVSSTESMDEETPEIPETCQMYGVNNHHHHDDEDGTQDVGAPCIGNGTGRTNGSQTRLHVPHARSNSKSKGRRKNKPRVNNNSTTQVRQFYEEKQRISLSKERRAARTMGIIMGVFVLCWLPFFLMYVIFPFCPACLRSTDARVVNFIVWLGYINSSLNPIIYTIFNIDFRRAFKSLLQGKCRT